MISIIIPTRNEERCIGEVLTRLKAGLRRTPHEIIVSDGASTDRTVAIARQTADRVIEEPEPLKRTIGRGRNLGAAAATGDFVVFMDADTHLLDPDAFFGEALAAFTADDHLVGVTVTLKVSPDAETFADKFFFGMVNVTYFVLNNMLRIGGSSGEFQMVRTSSFRQIGGFCEDLPVGEDNEFFRRLAKIGRTRMLGNLVIFHTGRRGHIIGWPKLFSLWIMNAVWSIVFRRSYSKEWRPVRTDADR